MKAQLFISRLSLSGSEVVVLNIPGIINGHALSLEAELDLPRDQIRALLPKMAEALKTVQIVEE